MNKSISFYTPRSNFIRGIGYSEAAYYMVNSLAKLGFEVPFDSPKAKAQLHFCQPTFFADALRSGQRKIALLPWESTEPMEDWLEILEDVDELWATSSWCADIYRSWGLEVQKVYPHGIGSNWTPKRKRPGSVLKFLHAGEPAPRKGGQLAYEAFKKAFGEREDVCLYIKTRDHSTIRNKHNGSIVSKDLGKNVKLLPADLPEEQLILLYQQCDFLVYPSYGEGFGFFGLQGLATGTPTICTAEWAEYKHYLGDLALDSKYIDSPWPEMHPGQVVLPDVDQLVDKLRYCVDNVEALHQQFYRQAFDVHTEFDWEELTKNAFENFG
jgi:glycosyltransferase involved in cell wall biosynthesis